MGIPSFFKTPKNKQFNYSPRYYDERKERLEKILNENPDSKEENYQGNNIRGQFKSKFRKSTEKRRNSNLRMVVIIIILFIITYFFLLK